MATLKQKKALENVVKNGGNVSKAMRDAGYAEATIENPKNLTKTDAWKELMDEYLPDSELARVHQESLVATKIKTSLTEPDQVVPDHMIRLKAVELGYKIKNRLVEKKDITSDGERLEPLHIIITEQKKREDE